MIPYECYKKCQFYCFQICSHAKFIYFSGMKTEILLQPERIEEHTCIIGLLNKYLLHCFHIYKMTLKGKRYLQSQRIFYSFPERNILSCFKQFNICLLIKNFAMFTCRSKVCLLLKLMKIEIFLQLVRVKVQNDHKLTEYILNEFLLHLKNDFCIKGIQYLQSYRMFYFYP